MTDVGLRHVTRVTLFRNGDPNFNGKNIVVNPRYYRNFESFLDTATYSTQCTSAVTRICTPLGRHKIESVDQLSDGGTYVAVGRENFKRLKYGQARPRKIPLRLPPVWRNHLPSSGRFRKVYEGEKQALKRIYVYRNGDNITPARMILLKKRMLTDMELVLAALQDSGLHFDFAISKLFTLNGKQIHDCDEIVHDGKYVAIERGSRFKSMNYGGHVEVSPRNAVLHSTRFPPLFPQNNNTSVSRSPKKQVVKAPTINKPRPPPVKQEKNVPSSQRQPIKKQELNKRSGVPNQQSVISISQDDNRESFSNVSLSATPPPLDESPDFTFSPRNKPNESETKDEKLPEIGEIPRDIDELPEEEQETIGAHIYKASGMHREWGDMVNDSHNKTLDNVPAEEVVEEIMEDIEDVTEISETHKENAEKDGKMEEESKKELEKGEEKVMETVDHEEVVESSVREDDNGTAKDDKIKASNNNNDDNMVKQVRSDSEASRDDDIQSDEELEEEEKDDSEDEMISNDGDDTRVDDDKVHDSDAVDNDDEKVVGADSIPGTSNNIKNNDDSKDHGSSASDDDNENDDDDEHEDDGNDESPAVSQNPSRRSSQEMNSEDEVKSEDEVDEKEDEKDDDDDDDDEKDEVDDDDKSEEEEESEDDKDEEDEEDDDDKEDEDDDSSVASEPEDDASNTDPESENEDETLKKDAVKENKTNQKFEKQRAQPDVSTKKGKPDMTKGRSTKRTRDVNKA